MIDIELALRELLGTEEEIDTFLQNAIEKHLAKEHFIPIKYRVLSGLIQSLNIKFGNFLEILVEGALSSLRFNVIKSLTRQRTVLELEGRCEQLIDAHINNPLQGAQAIRDHLPATLEQLLKSIFDLQNRENGDFHRQVRDVNLLVERGGIHYYLEIKYNDDHDTGKHADINRKFLKTYAGLVHRLRLKDPARFKPILYYFNPNRRYYPSHYLEDGRQVFRALELFELFGSPQTYDELTKALSEFQTLSEAWFDQLRERVFQKVAQELSR